MAASLWAVAGDVQARTSGLSDADALLAVTMASEQLQLASGHQFGTVTRTVRPQGCGQSCDFGPPSTRGNVVGFGLAQFLGPWPLPGPSGGMAAACGGCGCWSTSGIELAGPVVWDADHPIVVKVDGTLLVYGDSWIRVDRAGRPLLLVRVDGGIFPNCQDLRLADTQPGTCSVTYTPGIAVPELGRQAAIALAVQIAKQNGWVAGESCLPDTVRSISRQGVNVVGIDLVDLIKNGGTGITVVDQFVQLVNPHGLRRRARVFSPDVRDPLPVVRSLPA